MAKRTVESRRGKSGGRVTPAPRTGNRRNFYVLLGLVAVGFVAFIAYQMNKPTAPIVTRIDPSAPLPASQGYLLGDSLAPVEVIEFADFECNACARFYTLAEPDVKTRLVDTRQISYRFYDFPLPQHRNSWHASMAAACANEQGKFWEMHDQIFQTQDRWNGEVTRRPKAIFETLAKDVGLDVGKWEDCFDNQKYLANIQAHLMEGERRKVGETPTFIIGTRMISGVLTYDRFKAYVDSAMAEVRATEQPLGDTAAKKQ